MKGKRYNEGKVPLNQLPASVMHTYMLTARDMVPRWYFTVLTQISMFQEGRPATLKYLISQMPWDAIIGAAQVFEYGAQKYEQWNWTHGMKWSTVLGCMFRHMYEGNAIDEESNLPHEWHVACNVIMLEYYWRQDKGENDIQFITEDTK